MKNTHLKTPLLVLMTTILIAMCSCDSNDTDITESTNTASLRETRKTITLSKDQISALQRRAIIPLENTVTEIVSTALVTVVALAITRAPSGDLNCLAGSKDIHLYYFIIKSILWCFNILLN